MGYDRETTPALDALAEDGIAFTNAVAPGPSTPESMPATFTGQYPLDAMDPSDVDRTRACVRRHLATRETLAERLRRRGYATAAFTPNPYTSRHFGFDAGFDRFEDFAGRGSGTRRLLQRLSPSSDAAQAVRMALDLARREEVFRPWESYVGALESWLASAPEPHFAWVHLMDPHVPYLPAREYRTLGLWQTLRANFAFWRGDTERGLDPATMDRLRTAYEDTVRYADAFVGRLREHDDLALVVHADHGEAFGEHGTYGHEQRLYEENVHVPLVFGGDGVPDAVVETPTSLRRLLALLVRAGPLVLHLVDRLASGRGVPVPARSPDPTADLAVTRTAGRERVAVRGRRLKLHRGPSGTRLYDLERGEDDPLDDADLRGWLDRRADRFLAAETECRHVRTAAESVARTRADGGKTGVAPSPEVGGS
jgi:arylsulfatase